jgi:hypothetical protein
MVNIKMQKCIVTTNDMNKIICFFDLYDSLITNTYQKLNEDRRTWVQWKRNNANIYRHS